MCVVNCYQHNLHFQINDKAAYHFHLFKDADVAFLCSTKLYFKVVADSALASKANTGVPIQREPKDFHCLAVLEHSSSNPNTILFFLIM